MILMEKVTQFTPEKNCNQDVARTCFVFGHY